MSLGGVIHNIFTRGPVSTFRSWKEKQAREASDRQAKEAWEKELQEMLAEYRTAYLERPFLTMETEARRAYFKNLAEREKTLKQGAPDRLRECRRELKALYVKERIPEAYTQGCAAALERKVIFLEENIAPSQSSRYLANRMKRDGDYAVHMASLHKQSVSGVEFYENALAFARDFATAKAVFISTGTDVLSYLTLRPESKVIQLWHGVGIFKKVGFSTADNPNFGKSAEEWEEYDGYRNCTYVTIPSPEQAWIFEEAMHIPADSGVLAPVGVSRTDVFYDDAYRDAAFKKLYGCVPQAKNKKVILYAPTFRGRTGKGKAPKKPDYRLFAEALKDEYVILVKQHHFVKKLPEIPEEYRDRFVFSMNHPGMPDIEQLLTVADVLITDYSSVAFEFALMERPILFYAYDLEKYREKRGLYQDFETFVPGPVCRTSEEMVDYICHLDERFDRKKVTDFKQKYVRMCDGHATERTLALLDKSNPGRLAN